MSALNKIKNRSDHSARHAPRSLHALGFTVTEILVVISIAAVLAALAAPSLRNFFNEQRLAATMGQLANDLNFARSEAIKRNARVLQCARGPAATTCANR